MPLSEPRARRAFRKELDRLWLIGRSLVLGWRIVDGRVALLLLPHGRLPEIDAVAPGLLESESRLLTDDAFDATARRFDLDVVLVETARFHALDARAAAAIDDAVRRYAIWFTPRRAVALVDIVAFSRASRIEQVAQLNGLAASIAIAERRFAQRGVRLDLGRSPTGDGFYLWHRRTGRESEAELLALLLLALADNRFAGVAGGVPAPRLRAAFTAGGHFSFQEPDDAAARARDYIVGEATIALARLVAGAAPRQILLGAAAGPVHGPGGRAGGGDAGPPRPPRRRAAARRQTRRHRAAPRGRGAAAQRGRARQARLRPRGVERPRRRRARRRRALRARDPRSRRRFRRSRYSATVRPPST